MHTIHILIVILIVDLDWSFPGADGTTRKKVFGTSKIIKLLYNRLGPKLCLKECSRWADCKAINFNVNNSHCYLLKDITDTHLVDDEEFLLLEHSSMSFEESPCWPNQCSYGQKCVVVSNGQSLCLRTNKTLSNEDKAVVLSHKRLENIALGKTASQMPINGTFETDPNNSIDGNLWTIGHTAPYYGGEMYWMVDLGETFFINEVVMYNRGDCCGFELRDMDITVGTTNAPTELCGHFTGPGTDGQQVNVKCSSVLEGQYVRITRTTPTNTSFVHLAEVQVFAFV